jgi:5'-nucleotidase
VGLKIIVTNDDGIDAPGLAVLVSILETFGEVVVVAPETPQSWISHKVTVHQPIQVQKIRKNWFKVSGTPADCSRIALKVIMPEADWLASGINPGANLGSDVYNSGTVAAAREAAILGCKAMAISQYIAAGKSIDWTITSNIASKIIALLLQKNLKPGDYWNINLPHSFRESGSVVIKFCRLDTNPHQYSFEKKGDFYSYTGTIHNRPRDKGKDVDMCFSGNISVTGLSVGCTKLEL